MSTSEWATWDEGENCISAPITQLLLAITRHFLAKHLVSSVLRNVGKRKRHVYTFPREYIKICRHLRLETRRHTFAQGGTLAGAIDAFFRRATRLHWIAPITQHTHAYRNTHILQYHSPRHHHHPATLPTPWHSRPSKEILIFDQSRPA